MSIITTSFQTHRNGGNQSGTKERKKENMPHHRTFFQHVQEHEEGLPVSKCSCRRRYTATRATPPGERKNPELTSGRQTHLKKRRQQQTKRCYCSSIYTKNKAGALPMANRASNHPKLLILCIRVSCLRGTRQSSRPRRYL